MKHDKKHDKLGYKVLVLSDLQCPFQSKKSLKAVEKYMASQKWDYLIYLGDFLDYFCISKYNDGKPGLIEGKTIMKELAVGKEVLERHIKIVRSKNKNCQVVYLEGNHEARAYDFVMRYPQLKGIIEPEIALDFKKNKVKYVKSWSTDAIFKLGKANFTHGNYTNDGHAKKMVSAYEDNIFYGHVHDCNSYNKTSRGSGKTKVGQSLGCLCDYPKGADYMKGAPNKWQEAVTTFYFQPNGHFQYYISRIFENKFIGPDGKLYE